MSAPNAKPVRRRPSAAAARGIDRLGSIVDQTAAGTSKHEKDMRSAIAWIRRQVLVCTASDAIFQIVRTRGKA